MKSKMIEPPRWVPRRSCIMGWMLLSTLTLLVLACATGWVLLSILTLLGSSSCGGMGCCEVMKTKWIEPPRSVPKRVE
jgi:hypothetical protein